MDRQAWLQSLHLSTEQEWQNCLAAMEQYGENHWWEGEDLRAAAYAQLHEPILLMLGHAFGIALSTLLGRPMLHPDTEFSLSNITPLTREAQKAWTEGTPTLSPAQIERLHREIQERADQDLPV